MAVTQDMISSWRHPRIVMRRLLNAGRREDRALAVLMAGCFVIFIAQWPRLSRIAAGFGVAPGNETPELSQLVAYEFVSWMMVWPLAFYLLAAIFHLIAKAFGGKGSFFSARYALFWALLSTTPIALLYGLCTGLLGPVASTQIVGAIWIAAFGILLGANLIEAENPAEG